MKKLFYLLVLIVCSSCATGYHYNKHESHKGTQTRSKHDIKSQQKDRDGRLYKVRNTPHKNWGW